MNPNDPWRYDVPKIWPWSKTSRDPLLVRPGSTLKRDAYKVTTAGLTGITAFGALAVTGSVAGIAAHEQALAKKPEAVQPPAPQVLQKRRKHRTVVRTRIVHAVSSVGVASTGGGGVVRSSSSVSHSSGGSTHTVTHSAPKPAAPAPAPSSGS